MDTVAKAGKAVVTQPPAKKLTRSEQRKAWIVQGLCGMDGKAPIWKGHSRAECKKHVLYFREKAQSAKSVGRGKVVAVAKTKRAVIGKAGPPTIPFMIPAADIAKQIAASTGRSVYVAPMPRTEKYAKKRKAVG